MAAHFMTISSPDGGLGMVSVLATETSVQTCLLVCETGEHDWACWTGICGTELDNGLECDDVSLLQLLCGVETKTTGWRNLQNLLFIFFYFQLFLN